MSLTMTTKFFFQPNNITDRCNSIIFCWLVIHVTVRKTFFWLNRTCYKKKKEKKEKEQTHKLSHNKPPL